MNFNKYTSHWLGMLPSCASRPDSLAGVSQASSSSTMAAFWLARMRFQIEMCDSAHAASTALPTTSVVLRLPSWSDKSDLAYTWIFWLASKSDGVVALTVWTAKLN